MKRFNNNRSRRQVLELRRPTQTPRSSPSQRCRQPRKKTKNVVPVFFSTSLLVMSSVFMIVLRKHPMMVSSFTLGSPATTAIASTSSSIIQGTITSTITSTITTTAHTKLHARGPPPPGGGRRRPRRRRSSDDDDDENDDYVYDDFDDEQYDAAYDDYDDIDDLDYRRRQRDGMGIPSAFGQRDGWRLPESVSKALLAGVFVLGIGLGVTVDSAINTSPKDLASRDAVDQAAPNSKLCAEMGASAMAFDQRVFVSFNPFNVYVSQADVKPACVLRQANIVPILKDRKLINDKEVFSCKANMNTWAFVGDLDDQPQLSCVYKSEDAQNEFLSNPKFGIGEDYLDDDRQTLFPTSNDVKKKAPAAPGATTTSSPR